MGGKEQGDLPIILLMCLEYDGKQEFTLPSAVSVPVHLTHRENLTAMWTIVEFTAVFPFYVIKNKTKTVQCLV